MDTLLSDLEIANKATKKHIKDIGNIVGIPEDALIVYGNDKAKINYDFLDLCKDKSDGKLILVTAISPTPAGEGKTTTSVGLVNGLCHIGKKSYDLSPGTKSWTMLWNEGRSSWWRVCSSRSNDRY